MKNYADRGGCHPQKLKVKVDNILRDLVTVLKKLTSSCGLFFSIFNLSAVSEYKHRFFLADTRQKGDKINRTICFTYSCFPFVQF